MALTNVTKKEDSLKLPQTYRALQNLLQRTARRELVLVSVVNSFLSIAAFLGNTLILVALHKESSLHLPSKLLYRNLAITDLCVGIIVEPLAVTYWISVVKERWDICYFADLLEGFLGYTLCAVSFFTLTVISVDRLLALLLGLRYRQVVTLKKTCSIAICLWIFSIFGASTLFWNLLTISQYQQVATVFWISDHNVNVFYTKIFFTLRPNQIHFQNHVVQAQPTS